MENSFLKVNDNQSVGEREQWEFGSIMSQLSILDHQEVWLDNFSFWAETAGIEERVNQKDVIQSLLKIPEKSLSLLNIGRTIFSSSLLAGNRIAGMTDKFVFPDCLGDGGIA